MGREIERKFLVRSGDYRRAAQPERYEQGYLATGGPATVRVRMAGARGYLTVKGRTQGLSRDEFEYPIPADDARAMLQALCPGPRVEKLRYRVAHGAHTWEVDEFLGENEGLVVAEVELSAEDEPFERPPWLGEEVTSDPRYRNSELARHPYRRWSRPG